VHFRTDENAGERLGREIARYVLRHSYAPRRD